MKKIINFFKYIIKVIFGLFGEFISSKAKVVKKIETKQVNKIEKEVNYKYTVGTLPNDDNSLLSIYKEELKEFRKSTSDKKLKSKVDNIVKKIDLILDKKTETDNLKLFIIASNDLLSMYYDDYNYYLNKDDKEKYLNSLKDKLNKLVSDVNKKSKEFSFYKTSYETKKLDKYSLLKSTIKIDELVDKINKTLKHDDTLEVSVKNTNHKVENNITSPLVDNKKKEDVKEKSVSKKEFDKPETKKGKREPKKDNDEVKKEKLKSEILEIKKSINLINTNINENEILSRQVRIKNKYAINSLRRNAIKISMALIPISLFKNKLIGTLTSAFMLNNTIRALRRGFNSEIEYLRSNEEDYITNDAIKTKIEYVRSNTLNEIALLKSDIRVEYLRSNDTSYLELYNEVDKIENDMKKSKEKSKEKVKINYKKY